MKTYKLIGRTLNPMVQRLFDNACIPYDPANTDYAEFKKLVAEGAELQDADGNVMSAEAAQEFIRNLL